MGHITLFTACCFLAVSLVAALTNGKTAAKGQFPYVVGLSNKYDIITYDWCTGVLIGAEWVLTTAACVNYTKSITVYLGTNTRRSGGVQRTVYTSESVFWHDEYHAIHEQKIKHNIALIKIDPVTFTALIQPVRLPSISKTFSSYAGKYGVSAGWGYTNSSYGVKEYATDLQWASFEIITNEECKQNVGNFHAYVLDDSICVATTNGTSPCVGDDGSPLVLEDTNVLVGVRAIGPYGNMSWFPGCDKNHPNIYTRITDQLQWIKELTGIYY